MDFIINLIIISIFCIVGLILLYLFLSKSKENEVKEIDQSYYEISNVMEITR